ncbi:putative cyclin-D6-1 [Camellia lanceoleosa]|uniref:Cyclin-D6-1 n=1 Tax=Camellia lanceoleosa TaxID=1840588 RepID=A0ACC0J0T0_9ERIC|nr:putative cyclin-D6-1 [Camellia lanceoleosa]
MLSKGSDYDEFIPYLAVNYLDQMLSRKSHLPALERNPCKNTKLFAICCFTLASKTRNGDFSVPNFLAKRKLTTSVNPLLLLEMERRILTTLEWRMQSLTTINFLEYFYPFFKLRHPQQIRGFTCRDISQSILSVQGDIKFTQFKPSIIAASAVLSASFEAFKYNSFNVQRHSSVASTLIRMPCSCAWKRWELRSKGSGGTQGSSKT